MGEVSKIEWTHSTVNFWWGCTKVSPACAHCYAEKWAAYAGGRVFGHPVRWGRGEPRAERLVAARKEALRLEARARASGALALVFVNSMADWLDDEVPLEWLAFLLETISLCPHVVFQLLTKRPENWEVRVLAACMHMAGYRDGQVSDKPTEKEMQGGQMVWDWVKEGRPPANVWIGTTLEDQPRAEGRLKKIPAVVRFLSCEPLLGPLVLPTWFGADVDWVICGGESGPGARPMHPAWARGLRDQCVESNVAFFFKQWGDWVPGAIVHELPDHEPQEIIKLAENGRRGSSVTLSGVPGAVTMCRVGKRIAGRVLDGRTWDEMPGEAGAEASRVNGQGVEVEGRAA